MPYGRVTTSRHGSTLRYPWSTPRLRRNLGARRDSENLVDPRTWINLQDSDNDRLAVRLTVCRPYARMLGLERVLSCTPRTEDL